MADRNGREGGLTPFPYRDPAEAFAAFAHEPGAVLLDSAAREDVRARYSLVGLRPSRVAREVGGTVRLDHLPTSLPLLEILRGLLTAARSTAFSVPSPPRGEGSRGPRPGLIGFIGYEAASRVADRLWRNQADAGRRIEACHLRQPGRADPGPRAERGEAALGPGSPPRFREGPAAMTAEECHGSAAQDSAGPPDAWLGFYDTIAVFDHRTRTAWTEGPDAEALAAELTAAPAPPAPSTVIGRWLTTPDATDAQARIARLLALIAAGDLYQANLTRRWMGERPAALTPFDLHRRLRARASGPFGAFLNTGPMQLASVSPERFIRLDADGAVETRPIKGTRPRSSDRAVDAALAAELLASDKDRAENLMIADLMRNDLSRIAVPGSVRVPSLCALESFPGAHHLVSAIQARLAEGLNAFDLLAATLPGGSITGAPKRRAMQVIAELEGRPRGPYCGTLLRIGLDGAMDSAILIRTLVIEGARVTAQAGGGIVADSDPAAEVEEARVKVAPLLAALEQAG